MLSLIVAALLHTTPPGGWHIPPGEWRHVRHMIACEERHPSWEWRWVCGTGRR